MTDEPQPAPQQGPAETRRQWLEQARQTGVGDTFGSKRQQPRFSWRALLDIRITSTGDPAEPLNARARDISAGGLMFFCREQIGPSTSAEVSVAGEVKAVPVVVKHCTQTPGGYLIGADFVD